MVEVKWARPALQQLGEILEYIALDKPEASAKVARRVFKSTDKLGDLPLSGQKIPEFPHRQFRRLWCKPCWIYYRVKGKTIFILHVRRAERVFRVEDLLID